MDVSCTKEEFIRDFSKQIQNKSASLFIGSGLSRAAGYVDWKGMLKEVAEDIGLNVDKEHDLISLAEYYVNSKKNRSKINMALSQFFSKKIEPTETHRILASLHITNYWTTNYDKLLEHTFEELNMTYSFLTNDQSLKKYINGNEIIIHKLHGDVDTPNEAVITKTDYDEFAYKHEILLSKLKGEMCTNTFLFLGYSFSDTDINHILTRIKLFYKGQPARNHYCIQEIVKQKENEPKEEFEYRKRKQDHHILDLQNYGVHTVLVEDYNQDIPKILNEIKKRINANNVFISGACDDTNENLNEYVDLTKNLASWLIKKDYKIYTGYGQNIGSAIISGVYDVLQNKHYYLKKFSDQVVILPFPYKSKFSEKEKKEVYEKLRKDYISNTQIFIIINGTKKYYAKQIISSGAIDEFEIANKLGCLIIPIAVTGGAAYEIWEKMKEFNTQYTNSTEFNSLIEHKDCKTILKNIDNILKKYM